MNHRNKTQTCATPTCGRLLIGVLAVLAASCSVSEPAAPSAEQAPQDPLRNSLSNPKQSDSRAAEVNATPSTAPGDARILLGTKAFLIDVRSQEHVGDAANFVDSRLLRSRAGDGQASYEIHARVASCKRALDPGDDEEYKAYASMGLGERFSKRIEQEIENCKGLSERPDITGENWIALAAAQGSIEARLLYAQDPRTAIGNFTDVLSDPGRLVDYRQNAVGYLKASVSSGNLDSVEALANIYDRGIIAERSPSWSLGYWLALHRANPSAYSTESVNRISSTMQADEIDRARKIALDVYRSCCE